MNLKPHIQYRGLRSMQAMCFGNLESCTIQGTFIRAHSFREHNGVIIIRREVTVHALSGDNGISYRYHLVACSKWLSNILAYNAYSAHTCVFYSSVLTVINTHT